MFSDVLKDLRAKKALSQAQLAKSVGVSPGNISDWESGKTNPGYNALASIARFFNVSADYLLELPHSEAPLSCDGKPLTESETDIVAMCRLLDARDREDVFDYVNLKYEKATGKKGSVYLTYADTNETQNGVDGAAQDIHKTGSGIA